ncbi:hypothetical protein MSAS_02980 [Mycobacterium saskatchewanense]|uniref:Uncharacterized protein n=1 Tax=Mycobacterium saskatchewanense TaxID=220927 RepID=A0AAJ3NTD4_9MYCO|nr:hypothetical protein [Mycobacterium saskatchewanense]ORW75141.1 hypothetical protein AWC23_02865 [Mycobacterium saskatchewanense]BBX61124.1 hypothetical protein MSAS_02980 [Mycobacterium saskatchewanense]
MGLTTILPNKHQRALYLAALRYRLRGNVLRFICETHQEIPPQPPAGAGTLACSHIFDPQGTVDPHIVYYLKASTAPGAAIPFVSGSPTLTPNSVARNRPLCAGIYTRHTNERAIHAVVGDDEAVELVKRPSALT